MDGTKNLMVPRGDKSVWDKPSLSASLSSYDQERWLAAAWGSALVMVGARRGGFGGGLMAMLGTTLTFRADTPGRYTFECSKMCGAGHNFMRGELVVRERSGKTRP